MESVEGGSDTSSWSFAPQLPQKRLPAGPASPQRGQMFSSAPPQSPQNLLPSGFSVPQLGQRMKNPVLFASRVRTSRSLDYLRSADVIKTVVTVSAGAIRNDRTQP